MTKLINCDGHKLEIISNLMRYDSHELKIISNIYFGTINGEM
jgi:hypothetical protein